MRTDAGIYLFPVGLNLRVKEVICKDWVGGIPEVRKAKCLRQASPGPIALNGQMPRLRSHYLPQAPPHHWHSGGAWVPVAGRVE